MNGTIQAPPDEIAAFCKRWRVTELALFGSALREDFTRKSDVDVLVRFDPEARTSLSDMARMQEELSRIFGRRADLVERRAIEQSRNYIRRKAILESAQCVYAA